MTSVYIHIPFCNTICSYCDFCKLKYNTDWVHKYLLSLKNEIIDNYKGEKVRTLYIGGGTPSCLSINELNELFDIIKLLDLSNVEEFTFECNIESITIEKLILLKKYGVNRLSIGIQTFNSKYLKLLNRDHDEVSAYNKISLAKNIGFNNINVDFMYALPNETIEEVKDDLIKFLNLNVNHISCYSLMIEKNTKLYIDKYNYIDEEDDYKMYKYIESTLKNNGYTHYEISNYCKDNYESKHNLVYWNNDYYYGFGLSASGYLNNYRYDNTKNIKNYIDGKYVSNIEKVNLDDKIKYELILGFRKIKGINKKEFKNRYKMDIHLVNGINNLLSKNMLKESDEYIYISDEWIYKSNEILISFV